MIRTPIVVFALVFLAAAAVLAPMRAAAGLVGVERLGLSAASVSGTVWSGELHDARFRGALLGDTAVRLDPAALLTGTVRLDLGAAAGRAALVRGGGGAGLVDADLQLPLSLLPAAAPLPGTLTTKALTVRFRDGRCVEASGQISADVLLRNTALLGESATPMTGEAACDGGALLLPLHGRTAAAEAALLLRVAGDGAYRLDTRIQTADRRLDSTLSLAGFAPAPGGGRARTDQGRLWR